LIAPNALLCRVERVPLMDAVIELARKDTVMSYLDPFVRQAAEEFPAALSELREQLPVDNRLIGMLGGSLSGMVVLQILALAQIPVEAAALVNPAVRAVGGRAHRGHHRAALPLE
jgi:hypothetical protein